MAESETALSDLSEEDIQFPVQTLRRTVSQESGISTLSGVSYQPPERTSTPTGYDGRSSMGPETPSRSHDHRGVSADEVRVAIMKGRLDTVRELYLAGIDINSMLNGGWTALMYACSYGEDEIVKYLVDNGADAHSHKDMFTALMAACASRRDCEPRLLQCCEYLLEYGADVNAAERHLMTPLMFASRENRPNIVAFLLENGADINAKDCRHWTPLCIAAYAGNISVLNLLLNHGADPNKVTLKGHTAFDIAEVNGKRIVADVLKRVTRIAPAPPRSPMPPKLETVAEESLELKTIPLNNNAIPLKPKQHTRQIVNKVDQNDDLYLFLAGIDLLDYLPLLREHKIDFQVLLLLEDSDFEKLGITELGIRKKLCAGILEIHKQPWTKDSLAKLPSRLTCHDVKNMLENLTSHVVYMKTSISFMLREVKNDATVLEKGVQDTGGIQALLLEHESLLRAEKDLQTECESLQKYLQSVSGCSQYNYIRYGSPRDSGYLGIFLSFLIGTGMLFVVKRMF
ncbi:ankyrin repeat, SAM and basic leucine zipper domain-containing protein 1 [Galendromus occidentalis]|uniref:Ankyrin repeat, SAM and basic leucine zipper domain-containing protein 1 n=1 Tax=Galendromus occidentalis TaxID=34638 RepID=A0AAJ6VYD4_9ACAR|nr:ankyrin repeat, SAM and basic leucine zipper domain-containing protein 1 [Galendromus occidentalis]